MSKIKFVEFDFTEYGINNIKFKFSNNWPVVYLLENGKEIYVGETNGLKSRMKQHLKDDRKMKMTTVHSFSHNEYNKSAILDLEATLINLFAGDGKLDVINGTLGSSKHEYFNRPYYLGQINAIWEEMKRIKLANNDIFLIENSDLFKFSPYKNLSEEQLTISEMIIDSIKCNDTYLNFIQGNPGTGKTVLGMYLLKKLREMYPNKKIGYIVPMDSLRETLRNVAKSIKGLYKKDIMKPSDLRNLKYDIVIVDEAHRLKRPINLSNGFALKAHRKVNETLDLGINEGDQLDWIMMQSDYQILFYDENQTIKPTDIPKQKFLELKSLYRGLELGWTYILEDQHRIKGGNKYLDYINNILDCSQSCKIIIDEYEARIYDNFTEFNNMLYSKEKEDGLTRMVSGYYKEWISQYDKSKYDFEIDGIKRQWNTIPINWPYSPNAIHEIGCIHTIQGYDLNNAFVIIGKEIDYNPITNSMFINRKHYKDKKGYFTVSSDLDLLDYILNVYRTLLSRGIRGVHLFIENDNLREYFKRFIDWE